MNKVKERVARALCVTLALTTTGLSLGVLTPADARPDSFSTRAGRTVKKYGNRVYRDLNNASNPVNYGQSLGRRSPYQPQHIDTGTGGFNIRWERKKK